MDFRTLRYVVAIAEHQNITKAAETLYVGQPTLSKFLIGLEKELGLKLFRRQGHRYLLTFAGEHYVKRAKQILQMGEDLNVEMSEILKRDVGILRVAFAPMRGAYLLPRVLPYFQTRHPNVKITVLEGSSTDNDARLLNGQADIAFYSKPEDENPELEYQTLAQEELLLCVGEGHPLNTLARRQQGSPYSYLDLAFLQDQRVLLLTPAQRTRQMVDSILYAHKVQLRNTFSTSNMQSIMGLVAEGYGVSFLFDCHLRNRMDQRTIYCYRFTAQPVICDFVASSRKGNRLPAYAQDFIEIVKNGANSYMRY